VTHERKGWWKSCVDAYVERFDPGGPFGERDDSLRRREPITFGFTSNDVPRRLGSDRGGRNRVHRPPNHPDYQPDDKQQRRDSDGDFERDETLLVTRRN
jgi:hypothetical protein